VILDPNDPENSPTEPGFRLPQSTGVTNATAISGGYIHSLALVP
jgi:hypothetical protein